jgi:hypothetical protein
MPKKGSSSTVTVPAGKMLKHVIDRLPDGIIDKKETGIGATTCEIESPRDSIIVVPTRALAYSKYEDYKDLICYVGSAYNGMKKSTRQSILAHHNDKSRRVKKFIAVADSFPRIIDAIGNDVYDQYFLMIDEVDSFQQESTYRSAMEDAADYYFDFKHRCAVSATYIDFHNQKFKDEPLTVISKEGKERHPLAVHLTNSVVQHTAIKVTELLEDKPVSEKILVACASIQLILKIIGMLDYRHRQSCKVLCGSGSQDDVEDYYGVLKKGKLPARLCFMTGAYFAGLDIKESYHAVIAINFQPQHAILTTQKIRQIFGRCREELYSRLIIAPKGSADKLDISMLEEEINSLVTKFLGIEECFQKYFDEDAFSTTTRRRYKEQLLKSGSDDTLRLVRLNKEDKYVRADFTIDALINMHKDAWKLWGSKGGFKQVLRPYYRVKESLFLSYPEDNASNPLELDIAARKQRIFQECLQEFEAVGYDRESILEKRDELLSKGELTGYRNTVYQTYLDIEERLEKPEDVIRLLKEMMEGKRDQRAIAALKTHILVMGSESHELKKKLMSSFEVGKRYTTKELLRIYNKILRESSIHPDQEKLSEANIVKKLGVYIELRRRKASKDDKDSRDKREVIGFNPYRISFKKPPYQMYDSE